MVDTFKNEEIAEIFVKSLFCSSSCRRATLVHLFPTQRPDLRLTMTRSISVKGSMNSTTSTISAGSSNALRAGHSIPKGVAAAFEAAIVSQQDAYSCSVAELTYVQLMKTVLNVVVEIENNDYFVEIHNLVLMFREGPLDLVITKNDRNLELNPLEKDAIDGPLREYTIRWWRALSTELPLAMLPTAGAKYFILHILQPERCREFFKVIERPDNKPNAPVEARGFTHFNAIRRWHSFDAWMVSLLLMFAEAASEVSQKVALGQSNPTTELVASLNIAAKLFRIAISAFMLIITRNFERYGAVRCSISEPVVRTTEVSSFQLEALRHAKARKPFVLQSDKLAVADATNVISFLSTSFDSGVLTECDASVHERELLSTSVAHVTQRAAYWRRVVQQLQLLDTGRSL